MRCPPGTDRRAVLSLQTFSVPAATIRCRLATSSSASMRTVTQKSSSTGFLLSALVLFAINTLNFYDRHVPGALTEPILKEFYLTDTQIGLLGSAFICIYALVGLQLGRIADSASRKKLLAAPLLISSSLTASAAFAGSFAMLLFSR